MAKIGEFKKEKDTFTGTIDTLTISRKVTITPVENPTERAPKYRIFAGKGEIGAVWEKPRAQGEGTYLSVKLIDPTLPGPLYAILHPTKADSFDMLWDDQK